MNTKRILPILITALSLLLSVAARADLFVSSTGTHQVLRYDKTTGAFIGVFASGGGLSSPTGLTFGPDGNLYVSSYGTGEIKRFNGVTGAFIDTFVASGSGGLAVPEDLVFGPDGNLYVAANGVKRYNGTTGAFIDTFVASGSGGLNSPFGLRFGADDNLYVASLQTDKILRYDGTLGTFIDTFASASLDDPLGLVFGPDGNLYVSSAGLTRSVQRYNGTSGAFIGTFVSFGSGGLSEPDGLVFGPDGNLYLVDNTSNNVKRYDGTTGAFIDTFVATGSGGLSAPSFLTFNTCTVTNTADSGPGSLRDALANAADGDTIDLRCLSGTITLTSGELVVTNSVTILGPGPANLAVDGNAASRVFNIGSGQTVTIASLTITNGSASGDIAGGGIYNDHSALTVSHCTVTGSSSGGIGANGGGIGNDGGTVTILASTISGNSAFNDGGGIMNGEGTVTVVNSTLSGNSAGHRGGGVFCRGGTLTVSASTFSGNTAAFKGGGVFNAGGTLTVSACTFSGNSCSSVGGIINGSFNGVGGTLEIGDTVLNAGASGENIADGTVTSDGYNLSSDNGGGFLTAATDRINTDPKLGPLVNNGGPTKTHALLPGSPAINKGKRDAIPALASDTDQRGFPRPSVGSVTNAPGGDGSDIGAYEVQPKTFSLTCMLTPKLATNLVNTAHTVTATVKKKGKLASGVTVYFSVATGPNTGVSGVSTTSVSGTAGFTYTGGPTPGTDTIRAFGSVSNQWFLAKATKIWAACGPEADLTGVWSNNVVQTCTNTTKGLRCKVKGTLLVQNIGMSAAPAVTVRFYLSSDGVQTNTFLKQVATGTVKLSKTMKRTLSASLPLGVNGSGQFILAVIDADDTVAECDENNNVIVFGPLP
jgi:streptogramin lyase